MTDSPIEPIKNEVNTQSSSTAESALRKSLIFFIFFMLPVIGLLVILIIQQRVDQTREAEPEVPAAGQIEETAKPQSPITDATETSAAKSPNNRPQS